MMQRSSNSTIINNRFNSNSQSRTNWYSHTNPNSKTKPHHLQRNNQIITSLDKLQWQNQSTYKKKGSQQYPYQPPILKVKRLTKGNIMNRSAAGFGNVNTTQQDINKIGYGQMLKSLKKLQGRTPE